MLRLRSILGLTLWLVVVLVGPHASGQTTVTGVVAQSSAVVRQRLPIYFTPLSTPQVVAPWIVTSETITTRTDTNGYYSVSLLRGSYGVHFGSITNDTATIAVTTDSGSFNLTNLLTSTNLVFLQTNIMVGATSVADGLAGLVPAPSAGDEGKFLGGDGLWHTVSSGGGSTVTNLSDIGDVALSSPMANQQLVYDGTNWVNATATGGGNTFDQDNDTTFTFDQE